MLYTTVLHNGMLDLCIYVADPASLSTVTGLLCLLFAVSALRRVSVSTLLLAYVLRRETLLMGGDTVL